MPDPITPEQLHASHRWFTLDELAHLPGNPNQGNEASLAASVDEFGWMDGVVVHSGVVIAGNHRMEQALAREEAGLPGYDLTDVIPDLDEARRMTMAIAHNRTTRLGEDDRGLLADAIMGLAGAPQLLAAASIDHIEVLELTTDRLEALPEANDPTDEWAQLGMPVHDQPALETFKSITLHFETEADWESFKAAAGCPPDWANRFAYWPHRAYERNKNYRYVDQDQVA